MYSGHGLVTVDNVFENLADSTLEYENQTAESILTDFRNGCALTHLANKKYDSVSFAIRITFEQI